MHICVCVWQNRPFGFLGNFLWFDNEKVSAATVLNKTIDEHASNSKFSFVQARAGGRPCGREGAASNKESLVCKRSVWVVCLEINDIVRKQPFLLYANIATLRVCVLLL